MAAKSTNQPKETPLVLRLRCCYYIPPSKVADVSSGIVNILNNRLPCRPKWEIKALKDWSIEDHKAEKAFVPLTFEFRNDKRKKDKTDLDTFEALWNGLAIIFRDAKTTKKLGLAKHDQPICWTLKDTKPLKAGDRMSRWMLPTPTEPIEMPAEKIEQVLYKLVQTKQRRTDHKRHEACGVSCFTDCVESQLFREQGEFKELLKLLDDVYGDYTTEVTIEDVTKAIEHVDKTLQTLVNLISLWANPKIVLRPTNKSKFVKNVRSVATKWAIRLVLLAYVKAADRKKVKGLCESLRRDLAALQRAGSLLASHVRLTDAENWQSLDAVCQAASPGIERNEMTSKMAIDVRRLSVRSVRATNFRTVKRVYDDAHRQVIKSTRSLQELLDGTHGRLFASRLLRRRERGGILKGCKCGIEDVIAAEKLGLGEESDAETDPVSEKVGEK